MTAPLYSSSFVKESTEGRQELQKTIPVIFSSNDYFVPYMSVMIESIIHHANAASDYEIIVLHRGISEENQSVLRRQILRKSNFLLRFIDVAREVESYTFYTENRTFFTAEAYYRLLAPFLLPEYDWAIYMDGDMVALRDIAALGETLLKGSLIAAVRDFCGLSDACDPESDRRNYMEETLKLDNWENYYISGLLVMNLAEFRKEFTLNQIMELTFFQKWRFHDQDVLNMLTQGKTVLLDPRWNVLQDYGKHRLMPVRLYREWKDSCRSPFVVHFGGVSKPWRSPRVPRAKYFWHYARKSPFYHEIRRRLQAELQADRLYRVKYCAQFFFPLGSQSYIAVKKFTRPLWMYLKTKLQ